MIRERVDLLRLYCNANEKWQGLALYRAVVELARHRKLSGASVFPVEMGFGTHRELHDIASEYSSFDVPVIVEIIDAGKRVAPLMAELEAMVGEGLVVVTPAQIVCSTPVEERPQNAQTAPDGSSPAAPSVSRRISGDQEETPMKIEGDAKRVTVYVGSSDTWHGHNLAVAIVERCRELGLAGATVSRGIMGFGKHSVIHKAHFLGLSDDLPERIEIVDRPAEIARLLPVLDEMVEGGLIVIEDVHVVRYLHDPDGANQAHS